MVRVHDDWLRQCAYQYSAASLIVRSKTVLGLSGCFAAGMAVRTVTVPDNDDIGSKLMSGSTSAKFQVCLCSRPVFLLR